MVHLKVYLAVPTDLVLVSKYLSALTAVRKVTFLGV